MARLASLALLKSDFEILAFLSHSIKNARQNLFFQSERIDPEKTSAELYIHYKSTESL